MHLTSPPFQLYAEARASADILAWHFVLKSSDGTLHLDVTDEEQGAPLERLELLAVVRGLEALDQPSRVALVTPSRYVSHGLRYGLAEWRQSEWQWESFGQMTAIKHEDLWRRVDQALSFHRVQCRNCRIDPGSSAVPRPAFARTRARGEARRREANRVVLSQRQRVQMTDTRTPWSALRQRLAGVLCGLGQAIAPQPAGAVGSFSS